MSSSIDISICNDERNICYCLSALIIITRWFRPPAPRASSASVQAAWKNSFRGWFDLPVVQRNSTMCAKDIKPNTSNLDMNDLQLWANSESLLVTHNILMRWKLLTFGQLWFSETLWIDFLSPLATWRPISVEDLRTLIDFDRHYYRLWQISKDFKNRFGDILVNNVLPVN